MCSQHLSNDVDAPDPGGQIASPFRIFVDCFARRMPGQSRRIPKTRHSPGRLRRRDRTHPVPAITGLAVVCPVRQGRRPLRLATSSVDRHHRLILGDADRQHGFDMRYIRRTRQVVDDEVLKA